jgi:hypothetical protein
MITYLRKKRDILLGKLRDYEFAHGITISERELPEEQSYTYEQHMKDCFRDIDTFYDFECVIYTKTNLNTFALVFYKVKNDRYCKDCSNAKERHVIEIVSSKVIPSSVQKYIRENLRHSVTDVSFTTGATAISRLF